MCGVVGMFGQCPTGDELGLFAALLRESRARGTHAAGFAWADPVSGSSGYARGPDFPALLADLERFRGDPPPLLVGHTRYATSGDWRDPADNQPVSACGRLVVLNGVLDGGTREEFNARWGVACVSANDAEILPRLLEAGEAPGRFAARVKGSLAAAWIDARDPARPTAYAVRNPRRPLWRVRLGAVTFLASTADIFRRSGLPECEPLEPYRVYSWPTE